MSARSKAAAARYDADKPRIAAAARTAPGLTGQRRQAMPDYLTGAFYGAIAARPRPPIHAAGDGSDCPASTGI